MQKHTGVWVDHRRAVVISLSGDEAQIETVDSNIESQPTDTTGGQGANPAGSPTRFPEGNPERRFDQHLTRFYREVEARLDGSVGVFVFGPGQAKKEFQRHLEANKRFSGIPVEVEAADNMSAEEAARKTEAHFKGRSH